MKKVLIVEDDLTFKTVIRARLESDGFKVWEAETCAKAIKICSDIKPQVILLDINLGRESGLDFAQNVVEKYETLGAPKVIAMSGILSDNTLDALEESTRKIFVDFLMKPFNYSDLYKLLKKYTDD